MILEPLELTFSSGTLSNVLCLISQLEFGVSAGASSNVPLSEGSDQNKAWRLSASCPSVSIVLPLELNSVEGTQDAERNSAVFERCGYTLPHSPISRSSLGFTLDALSVLYESKVPAASEERTGLSSCSDSGADTTVSCHRLLCFVTSPRIGGHGNATCMQRADIVASSGHAPLSIRYRSTPPHNGDSTGKSSFPIVPPLSTFKARQEDEDSDDEDAFCREFSSFAENASTPTRASDPQGVMLQEADQCSSTIEIYLPELVGDLTRDEAVSLSNILLAELSSIGKGIDAAESSNNRSEGSAELDTSSHITSIAVSIDQITLTAHQMIDEDTEAVHWYSHEMMAEGFKVHAVLLAWSRLKTVRLLAHELNLFEGTSWMFYTCLVYRHLLRLTQSVACLAVSLVRDLVQTHDIEAQSVLSFRDRCDNVRRRTFQNGNSVAIPIFYRSQLFAPLSPESPAVLVDILKPPTGEWNAHFTVYNLTHRCDVESHWLYRLKKLLGTEDRADSIQATTSASSSVQPHVSDTEPSLFKVRSF